MAIKNIVRMGNPILRQEAAKLSKEEILSEQTQSLIQDMNDTMKQLGGIGIAAPQIGVSKQVAIIDVEDDNPRYPEQKSSERYIIFNPEIEVVTQELQGFWEGCLSVPGLRGFVKRPKQVRIKYLDQNANEQVLEVNDFLSTVFQHELDHLFGKLYVDHITDMSLLSYQEEFEQFWMKEEDSEE